MLRKLAVVLLVLVVMGVFMPLPSIAQLDEVKLVAADAQPGAHFGRAMSIDGDTILVGAQTSDGRAGATYVFVQNGTDWVQQAKLLASDGGSNDQFGRSVDIDDGVAIIGAFRADSAGSDSGTAYVFERTGAAWNQTQILSPAGLGSGDLFGESASISGDYLVVGASGDDDRDVGAGAVYVFRRNGSSWEMDAKLTASDGAAGDSFGFSSAISGTTVVVGAMRDDSSQGAAYVFDLEGDQWVESAKLVASDGAAGDQLGSWFLSIDGDNAVVGALGDDDLGSGAGSAYVFHRDGGVWSQQAKLVPSDGSAGDQFGVSTAISGDLALIGTFEGGAAYLYQRSGTTWTQVERIQSSDYQSGDDFAYALDMDGDTAAIGADDAVTGGRETGAAYVYTGFGGTTGPRPPVVGDIPDVTITDGDTFADIGLDAYVDDPDTPDSDITWTATGTTDLTVTITNRIATITAPTGWTGTETLTFTATDPDGLTDSDTATYTINPIGAPEPPVVGDIPDVTITDGDTFADIGLDAYVDDPDTPDSDITWTATGTTDLTVTITNRIATITAPTGWTGTETLTFTATDPDGLTDSDTATYTINPVSTGEAPVVEIGDQTLAGGEVLRLRLDQYVTDPDTPDADLTWTITGNAELSVTYREPIRGVRIAAPTGWTGTETLVFTATDPDGLRGSADVTFTGTG